jgi:hypothetical protein
MRRRRRILIAAALLPLALVTLAAVCFDGLAQLARR